MNLLKAVKSRRHFKRVDFLSEDGTSLYRNETQFYLDVDGVLRTTSGEMVIVNLRLIEGNYQFVNPTKLECFMGLFKVIRQYLNQMKGKNRNGNNKNKTADL